MLQETNDTVFSTNCAQVLFTRYHQQINATEKHITTKNIEISKTKKNTANKKILLIQEIEKFG